MKIKVQLNICTLENVFEGHHLQEKEVLQLVELIKWCRLCSFALISADLAVGIRNAHS